QSAFGSGADTQRADAILPYTKKTGRWSGARSTKRADSEGSARGDRFFWKKRRFPSVSSQQAAVPEASDFPAGHTISGQQRRQHQIDYVRFGRAETAWRGDNRDLVLVGEQQQIARLDRRQAPLHVPANASHTAPD